MANPFFTSPFGQETTDPLKPRPQVVPKQADTGVMRNTSQPVPGGTAPGPDNPPPYMDPTTGPPPTTPAPTADSNAKDAGLTPVTTAPSKATGGGTVNYGGGWNEAHGQDPAALALKAALDSGLTGQAAVDKVNQNPALNGQIAFYADKGTYGAPGWYAAPNQAGGGALDLIKRSGSEGSGGAGAGMSSSGNLGGYPGSPLFGNQDYTGKGNALYDMLMGRAQQGLNVDPNDPIIRNSVDAYGAKEQQSAKNYTSGLAERQGPNSNIDAESRSASEKVGQDTAGFQAQMMQHEIDSRRQEIQQALSGAQGLLTSQQQMQLQEELAQLARAESHFQFTAGQGQQESQFARDLAQRGYEFDSNDQFRNSPIPY